MRSLIGFIIVMKIRLISLLFWRLEVKWINSSVPDDIWDRARILVLMNHTSLYEPLYAPVLPIKFTWHFISRMVAPAAEKTLQRPIVGTFWKLMVPKALTITRKRDDTWTQFMNQISDDSIIVIAPEGRMKRPNGLDLHGNPMTIRGGIADILEQTQTGYMILFYSGGLHHVQAPGETFPRPFKKLKMNLEWIDISEYKKQFPTASKDFKTAVIADLQHRLENNCPSC